VFGGDDRVSGSGFEALVTLNWLLFVLVRVRLSILVYYGSFFIETCA